jgi:pilus assembly protein CpaF
MDLIGLKKENFGVLYEYIENDDVTDIEWSNHRLTIMDLKKGIYQPDVSITTEFFYNLATSLGNLPTVNSSLSLNHPILEASGNGLRIEMLHDSVSLSGPVLSIRKSMPTVRITEESMLSSGYCPKEVIAFLQNLVLAKCIVCIAGIPGSGKTELLKWMTQKIDPLDHVITIEDTPEIHFNQINPGHRGTELLVKREDKEGESKIFSYSDALLACWRLNPNWILLSETRGSEAKYLFTNLASGAACVTTLHADDARKIPNRFRTMVDDVIADRIETDAYTYIDVGIHLRQSAELVEENGVVYKRPSRYIDQICLFEYDKHGNKNTKVLMDNRKLISKDLTDELYTKFKLVGIEDPFTVKS